MNAISAICFFGFVVLGMAAAIRPRQKFPTLALGTGGSRFINLFIIYVLLVSFAAGLSQHDMWPFSSWAMFVGMTPPATRELPTLRIVGVDATGTEHDIDFRAWQPLSLEELLSWINKDYSKLNRAAQDRVALYFLAEANRARVEALSPGGIGSANRRLGRLTAPTHVQHPAIWSRAEDVPPTPLVGLRIYEESWDLEARARHAVQKGVSHVNRFAARNGGTWGTDVTRILKYEYPHP